MTAIENDLDALDPTRLERLDSVPQDDPWYVVDPFYVLAKACIQCGGVHELTVPVAEYEAWKAGYMVQDAFRSVSADDRELFFISGFCGECFDRIFGAYYDDPEDEGFQMSDVEADADTLASAGWGTDEDYGYFGEDN